MLDYQAYEGGNEGFNGGFRAPDAVIIEPPIDGAPVRPMKRKPRSSAFVAAIERQAGFAGLYVVGPCWLPGNAQPAGYEDWPVKIGVTARPKNVVSSCRQWNHLPVSLMAFYWTSSPEAARRLKKDLDELLKEADVHRHGGWFDRAPDRLELELRFLAEAAHIELFDEMERQSRIEEMAARRAGGGARRLH